METQILDGAHRGNIDLVIKGISEGENIDEQEQEKGNTALMLASYFRHFEIVDLLLKNGATVDIEEFEQNTALHKAVWTGDLKIVELLLKNGADINRKEVIGMTPLMLSAYYGPSTIVKFLLENGADPDLVDDEGLSALDIALEQNNKTISKILSPKTTVTSIDKLETLSNTDIQIENFFEDFISAGKRYDGRLIEFYSNECVAKNVLIAPEGVLKRELSGKEYKELLKNSLPTAKQNGDTSLFTDIEYNKDGDFDTIKANRFSVLRGYSSPYFIKCRKDNKGLYKIFEEKSFILQRHQEVFPDDENGQILQGLFLSGVDLSTDTNIEFAFYLDDKVDSKNFVNEVQPFLATIQGSIEKTDSNIICRFKAAPTYQNINTVEGKLVSIATEYGIQYEGWEFQELE